MTASVVTKFLKFNQFLQAKGCHHDSLHRRLSPPLCMCHYSWTHRPDKDQSYFSVALNLCCFFLNLFMYLPMYGVFFLCRSKERSICNTGLWWDSPYGGDRWFTIWTCLICCMILAAGRKLLGPGRVAWPLSACTVLMDTGNIWWSTSAQINWFKGIQVPLNAFLFQIRKSLGC